MRFIENTVVHEFDVNLSHVHHGTQTFRMVKCVQVA